MTTFKLKSFAKINPLLYISEKREDGYHNLFTLYQTVSIFDEIDLTIEKGKKGIEISSNRDIPLDSSNLVYKAIELFVEEFKVEPCFFKVFIDKRIPPGGGMGGGSSNAGAVLYFLKKHFKIKANKRILDLAAKIGSDVPLFLLGGTVMGTGKGDRVTKIKDLVNTEFLAVFTGKHYPTEKMYSLFDEKCEKTDIDLIKFSEIVLNTYKKGYHSFYNDFDRLLQYYDRDLFELFAYLKSKGYKPMLSGSGSTFIIFGEDLSRAKKFLPENFKAVKLEFVSGSDYERLLFG
ncbi:4-diphosphocytidyl-2-C-methyl-D-erythritol kinase [Thermotomaculum hydrothermale]|uniref:4-diphosphocytidyl-2-C-methyl-D-erythritol kinase n=1 Tax=Thermotomaculum hydrothermale TaxID=981385 RepID=A0A7R6PN13_9BACT|nr:hypothetical protein [Thermotomaculum hydrothermale]BBB32588.1 4-diphosphocytidyl-2-C-methyl-D-erythritol kinase [Thermotomaculum hydrothermale]